MNVACKRSMPSVAFKFYVASDPLHHLLRRYHNSHQIQPLDKAEPRSMTLAGTENDGDLSARMIQTEISGLLGKMQRKLTPSGKN